MNHYKCMLSVQQWLVWPNVLEKMLGIKIFRRHFDACIQVIT